MKANRALKVLFLGALTLLSIGPVIDFVLATEQPDTRPCCQGTPNRYDPDVEFCCGGTPVSKEEPELCCHSGNAASGKVIDPDNEACCGGEAKPRVFFEKDEILICLNSEEDGGVVDVPMEGGLEGDPDHWTIEGEDHRGCP